MENSIGGTIIEAMLDISNAKHSPVSDLNLEIPWSLFHGSGHAIYFEFLEQDFTAHKLISWAIFPLNDHQRMRYRLQLRRVTAGPPSKLREVLQGGKHPIEKYPGYIMFSLHLECENISTPCHEKLPEKLHPPRTADGLKIFKHVRCPGNVPCHQGKWNKHSTSLAAVFGDEIYIYSALDGEYSATLALPHEIKFLDWIGETLVCALGRVCIVWNTESDDVVEVPQPEIILGVHTVASLRVACAFFQGSVQILDDVGNHRETIVHSQFREVISLFTVTDSVFVVTKNHMLQIFDGMSWEVSKISAIGSTVLLADRSLIYTELGNLISIDAELSMRRVANSVITNVTSIAVSVDKSLVAIGYSTGRVRILDLLSGDRTVYDESIFPCAIRQLSWSALYSMLSVVGEADPGSTLPVLILIRQCEVEPYLSPTMYEWTHNWVHQDSPTERIIDTQSMKRDIIRRSFHHLHHMTQC